MNSSDIAPAPPPAAPNDEDSVAGEEDPGAALGEEDERDAMLEHERKVHERDAPAVPDLGRGLSRAGAPRCSR
jgi:hypothetical protein